MEGKELHPTLDSGVYVFDPAEVARAAQERPRRAVDPTKEGERDARAFELLDTGHDLRHLVTTLRISADVAKRIVCAWTEVGRGDVVVSRACKVEIEQCLGSFRDAAELIQRARAATEESERVYDEFHQAQNRLSNLVACIGELAARSPALAEVVPEVRERLDGELAQMLDRAVGCGTTRFFVGAHPHAPIAPAVGESLAEMQSGALRPGVGTSIDTMSEPNPSTTMATVSDDRADWSAVGESAVAGPNGCESIEDLTAGPRVADGGAVASRAEVAASTGAAVGGAASGIRVARSPREQLLDEWIESLASEDARLQQLGPLLKRQELEIFAELERGIRTEVATTGSDSRREQLLDTLLVSLTEDAARIDKIGAVLTARELDIFAQLRRGLAEGETSAAMSGDASPE